MQLLILASVLTVGLCMPGGYTSQNLTDPAVMKTYMDQLADLQTKGLIFTSMNSLPTLTLLEVQTQVVSGMNYKFKIQVGDNVCTILYYEQSWTNTHSITSDTCASQKRQLAGGFSVQDATDPKWQEMLTKLSTKTLITLPTSPSSYDIVGVKQQVVAGMKYEFTLRVHGQTCTIMYYEVSWENKHEIISDTCSALVHSTGQLAGGWGPVTDTSFEGVQKCLGASLDVINGQENSAYRFVDTNIQSIEQQMVAGIKYRFTVEVGISTCSNSGNEMGFTSVRCPVNTNSQIQKQYWTGSCVYTAWQDPKTQVLNVEMAEGNVGNLESSGNAGNSTSPENAGNTLALSIASASFMAVVQVAVLVL